MSTSVLAGVDIGTERVTCAVGEIDDQGRLQITGAGQTRSEGCMRDGVIVDLEGSAEAVAGALEEAESLSSWEVTEIAVSISGTHVRGFPGRGSVNIEQEDDYTSGEITWEDVEKATETAQLVKLPRESVILSTIMCGYSIDSIHRLAKPPVGLRAEMLTSDIYMVTADRTAVLNLRQVVRAAGRKVSAIYPAASAGAHAVLTPDEMEVGVVFADIGAGTTDIAIYHSGNLVYLGVIPLGGAQLTRELQGMRIPWTEAETLKRELVDVSMAGSGRRRNLTVNTLGFRDTVPVSAEMVSQIAAKSVSSLFEAMTEEIRQAGLRTAELPAGIVLTGGASRLSGIAGAAARCTGLPAEVGIPSGVEMSTAMTATPEFSVAVGLVKLSMEAGVSAAGKGRHSLFGDIMGSVRGMFRRLR